jgi:hypothetical protein
MKGTDLTGHSGKKDLWTPLDAYYQLHRRFHFTYDAFASHENSLAPLYSTECGTYRYGGLGAAFGALGEPVQPGRGFEAARGSGGLQAQVSDLDGLTYPWKGERVFLNPPYTRGFLMAVARKMEAERNQAECIVGLIKCDVSTLWFAKLREFCHVEPLGRVKYLDPTDPGMTEGASFASAVYIVIPEGRRL